jgi:hypothetical protein
MPSSASNPTALLPSHRLLQLSVTKPAFKPPPPSSHFFSPPVSLSRPSALDSTTTILEPPNPPSTPSHPLPHLPSPSRKRLQIPPNLNHRSTTYNPHPIPALRVSDLPGPLPPIRLSACPVPHCCRSPSTSHRSSIQNREMNINHQNPALAKRGNDGHYKSVNRN